MPIIIGIAARDQRGLAPCRHANLAGDIHQRGVERAHPLLADPYRGQAPLFARRDDPRTTSNGISCSSASASP